jgi:hypothetical protein
MTQAHLQQTTVDVVTYHLQAATAALQTLLSTTRNGTAAPVKSRRRDKLGHYTCPACPRWFSTKQGRATHKWKAHG